jgi:hypothetical protein
LARTPIAGTLTKVRDGFAIFSKLRRMSVSSVTIYIRDLARGALCDVKKKVCLLSETEKL